MSLSQPSGEKVGDLRDFKWGNHRGVGRINKDIHFYESFVYEGVEYFLYDCAYFHHDDHVETSVGKLVQLYERPTHEKVVKVVWFCRPSEIRNFLGNYQPSWNELFLASGVGKGLSNINYVESIIGKCNVVCTSRDKRNPEPSETELKAADFFFNCAFDVGRCAIVDKFPDEIGGIEVGKFFNRKGEKKPSNPLHVETHTRPKIVIKTRTDPSDLLHRQVEDNAEVRTSEKKKPSSPLHVGTHTRPKIVIKTRTGPSDLLHWQVEDNAEVRTSEKKKPSSPLHVGTHTRPKIVIKTRTDPSDLLHRQVRTSENVAPKSSSHSFPNKKRKIIDDKPTIGQSSKSPENKEFDEKGEKLTQDKTANTCRKVTEVTKGPDGNEERSLQSSPHKKRKTVDEKLTISQSGRTPNDEDFDGKVAKFRQEKRVETCEKITGTTNRSDAGKIADKKSSISQSGKSFRDEQFDEKWAKLSHDKRVKTCGKVTEVTERPNAERRRWFKKEDLDQRLREAQEKDTLILLNNLDPSYTSFDVEDLVWHALKKKVEARVIEQGLNSSNYYGRALVIFKTPDAAEFAVSELKRKCLILGDGRIVSAQKWGTLTEPGKQSKFTGHFVLDKFVHKKQRQEMRDAVSTSHCTQSNTVEYQMAVEWLLQYKKSDACWEALYQKQMKEIEDVKNKLNMDRIFL